MWEWVIGLIAPPIIGGVTYQAKKNNEFDRRLVILETQTIERHTELKEDLVEIKDTMKGLVNFAIRGQLK